MSSKHTSLFVIALLLLLVSLSQAGRPEPADPRINGQEEGVEEANFAKLDEGCGEEGDEECLMRRTLVAHTDYIYTQGKHN